MLIIRKYDVEYLRGKCTLRGWVPDAGIANGGIGIRHTEEGYELQV